MKLAKTIHSFFALLPFATFICFLLILCIGIIHFGYVPTEGNPVDPYALGLDWLSVVLSLLLCGAVCSIFLWTAMSIMFTSFFKGEKLINRTTTILFCIGIAGFFVFKHWLPGVFGWVLD